MGVIYPLIRRYQSVVNGFKRDYMMRLLEVPLLSSGEPMRLLYE